MAVTNFTAAVGVTSVGTAEIDKLAASFDKLSGSIEGASKKSEGMKTPKWDQFASGVKDFIQNPLQAAGTAAEGFLTKIGPMGAALATGAMAAGAFAKYSMDAARSLGTFGDQIGDTSIRMGLTIKETQNFGFAMKYAGGDIGTLEGIMRKLSQEIEDGGNNLSDMGVKFRDVHTGAMLPMSSIVLQLSERLAAMPNVTERNTAAIKVMGRAALEVLPDLLELPQAYRRAGELSIAHTDAEIKAYGDLQKKMAEIDSFWDKMVRKLKAGVVVPMMWVAGSGKEYRDKGIYDNGGMFDQWNSDILGETASAFYGGLRGRGESIINAPLIAENDRRVAALKAGTSTERLSAAKKELDKLYGDLKTGVIFDSANAETEKKINAQKAVIAGIEAEIKATKDAEAAVKGLSAARMAYYDFARKRQAEWSQKISGIAGEAPDLSWKPVYSPAYEQMQLEQQWAGKFEADARRTSVERMLAISGGTNAHGSRMAQLASGPGGEVAALREALALRIQGAQQEFAIKAAHADLYDIDAERFALQQEMQSAGYEYEEKMAELQKRHAEEYQSLVVGGFQALIAGGGGLESFAKAQLVGTASKVVGNLASMTYKSGMLTLPGTTGADGKPSFLGRIFNGTPFGPEVKLNSAGDKLLMAGFELSSAAKSIAMSPSGGGGGFASTASSLWQLRSGMYGQGSGETPYEGNGLPAWGNLGGDSGEASGGSKGFSGASAARYGMAGIGAAAGTYGAITSSSTKGKLGSAGGAVMSVGAALPPPAGPIVMGIGAAMSVVSMFMGDPKQIRSQQMEEDRANRAASLPTGVDYVQDTYGRGVGYDYRGGLRPIQVTINQTIPAMDGPSVKEFLRSNPDALSSGIVAAIQGGNGEDLIGTLQERIG